MPSVAQKAKVQAAGHGKQLASILKPMERLGVPSATKVIFTIGPACQDVDTLCAILRAGGTCARIDLTWGSLAYHTQSLRNLSKAMLATKTLCAVMLDTLGREVYVLRDVEVRPDGWPKHGKEVEVPTGAVITLTTDVDRVNSDTVFPVNYKGLTGMVQEGDRLYIGRYLVSGADAASLYLSVEGRTGAEITCRALNDAKLGGLLTIFHMERTATGGATNVQNSQPLFATEDVQNIKALAREFQVDFLSLSFTRTADDVNEARAMLAKLGMEHTRIIAKLETRQSLLNYRSILNAADGIMISRGNLGLDCQPEKITIIQKNITTGCNLLGKPCIVTRIVDTMVNAPRPTRAEATDVANAVLDGADGLLLGAETLRGIDPANAVATVVACCQAAEVEFDHVQHFDYLMREAMKAEESGFSIPAGLDEESSPDSSRHGSGSAMAAMQQRSVLAASRSNANLARELHAMTRNAPSGNSSVLSLRGMGEGMQRSTFMEKLEALASSAVRAADKAAAKLILVFTDSGLTANLVAKYRPSMPILTLVVPKLVNKNMQWQLVGRNVARQCLLTRGLVPMLAVPNPDGEKVLRDSLAAAAERGLVKPGDNVVCVEKISGEYCLKMVSVDHTGRDVQKSHVFLHSTTTRPIRVVDS